MQRLIALAQIVLVVGGVFATSAALERFGLGVPSQRLPGWPGLLAHVVGLGLISMGLALALVGKDRRHALGLGPIRWPRLALFTLLGAMTTFVMNMVVVLTFITLSGGLSRQTDIAREKAAALSSLATIPVGVLVLVAVLAGIYEEVVFRGFLLGRLRIALATKKPAVGDALAVMISALLFGLGHVYQGALGVAQTTMAGLCLGALMVVSRSLWPSILTHAGIDVTSLVILHLITPMVNKVLEDMPR